jgi:type IX secretion system PorP/SprF family membrane protein
MKIKFFILMIGCLMLNRLTSQDFHFSQFNENPLLINPALAGSNHVMRVSMVYKDQWKSVTTPFRSYGVSFESRFNASNWEKADKKRGMIFKKAKNRMAGGVTIYNDKAGDSKLGTLATNLTYAMFFPLNENSRFSLGLQAGLVQRKMDGSKLIYSNQFDGYGYDPSLASGEAYTRQSFMYGDVGSGVLYSFSRGEKSITANNQVDAQIGFSAFHLNRPQQNFLNGESDRLYRKYVFHGNLLFGLPNTLLAIVPSWLVQLQGPNKEITGGLMIKYYIKDDSKYTGFLKRSTVGIGINYRSKDAIMPMILIETGRFAIGYSYNINVSGLTTVSRGMGGSEITLRMMTPNAFLYQRRAKALY